MCIRDSVLHDGADKFDHLGRLIDPGLDHALITLAGGVTGDLAQQLGTIHLEDVYKRQEWSFYDMMDKKPHIKPYLYGMFAGFGAISLSILFFFLKMCIRDRTRPMR